MKAAMGASIAVVPLTIPLLTGPATISTVVIYAERAQTFLQLSALVGYGVVIGAGHGAVLRAGRPDRARAGQDRHQRDDPADGPDPGGAGGGSDGAGSAQAVSRALGTAGSLSLSPASLARCSLHLKRLDQLAAGVAQALGQQLRELDQQLGAHGRMNEISRATAAPAEHGGLDLAQRPAAGVARLAVEHRHLAHDGAFLEHRQPRDVARLLRVRRPRRSCACPRRRCRAAAASSSR